MQQHSTLDVDVIDFASAAQAALSDLRERVGLDAWLVARRDGDDYVVLAAVDDVFGHRPGGVRSWEDSFCARMVDGSGPMVAPDVDRVPAYVRARRLSGIDAKSYIAVPMSAPDGEMLATLCAVGRDVLSDDMADVLPTVQVQAGMLGTLLAHELRIAAEGRRAWHATDGVQVDPLTGIANRAAWDAALAEEEIRAGSYASSAAIVVLDLDALRLVNTSSGLAAGDDLIQRTATLLGAALRSADFVARLDGGGFGLLLPLTDHQGAEVVAEHLVAALAEAQIQVSVGVASRRTNRGLVRAWSDADAALQLDRVRRAASRLAGSPDGDTSQRTPSAIDAARAEENAAGEAVIDAADTRSPAADRTATRGTGSVDALLRLARDQLGMDVAFLSVFEGANRRIRNAQSMIDLPVGVGFTQPSDESHCRLIADGVVPEVTPDAAAVPLFAALPITAALGIRAFVGVPLHRRNGDLYGTLCSFSLRPDETLQDRDAGVLRSIGEIAMDLVESEDDKDGARHDFITRLDRLYAERGPNIVYQPVVTLDRLEEVGFEALSRFPGSDQNPAQWFAGASAVGLGTELELHAIANAVEALPRVSGFLALNVSPGTVGTPAFGRLISSLPLHRIVLELTEHEQIRDYSSVLQTLRPLRANGLRIAVDDAGAGFASMAHILALVPDLIKLDISLVRGIDVDVGRQALAAALGAFAFKTGAGVIAEGVETENELACLRQLGIQYGQGYHLGRARPL